MVIYQYSDMVDNMDNFMAGVAVSYKPVATQELAFEVSNAYNNKFAAEYGSNPISLEKNSVRDLEASKNPLTYIVNWMVVSLAINCLLVGRGAFRHKQDTNTLVW